MEEKEILIPEEEKKPKLLKTAIIAACILVVFAVFYFVMQYFANNKPAEIPSTAGEAPAVSAPAQGQAPADTAVPANPDAPDAPASKPASKPASEPASEPTSTPASAEVSEAPSSTAEPQQNITLSEAMELCQNAAIKHLGEGTLVLPDFEGALTEVTFDGKKRKCYVFIGGGVEYFMQGSAGNPPARYCIDVETGEIFDAISAKYIK